MSKDLERNQEKQDRKEKPEVSSKAATEVQDEQKKNEQQKPKEQKSVKDAQKTVNEQLDGSNPCEIVDAKTEKKIDGLELNEDGSVKQYKDRNGETYKQDADGTWKRYGLLSPKGEMLQNVEMKDGNLNITYVVPKDDADPNAGTDTVTKQIRPDGSEVTKYPNATTLTTREGDQKVVTVLKDGDETKPMQTVKFAVMKDAEQAKNPRPPQAVYFKEGDNEYVRDLTTGEWKKNGEKWNGKITADSDGKTLVREDGKPSLGYQPDGTRVESNGPNDRRLTLTDGTTIRKVTDAKSGNTTMSTTRADGAVTEVDFDATGHATQMRYTKDGVTSTYNRDRAVVDQSGNTLYMDTWRDADGNKADLDKSMTELNGPNNRNVDLVKDGTPATFSAAGNNNIERRPLVEEVPENYQDLLAHRLEQSRNQMPGYANYFMYNQTKDNGDWDDKQVGRQYQAWGNTAWGMYANEMGYEFETANACVGAYKIASGKSQANWAFSKTFGQNPRDYELTKEGFEMRENQRNGKALADGVELPAVPEPNNSNVNVKMRNLSRMLRRPLMLDPVLSDEEAMKKTA